MSINKQQEAIGLLILRSIEGEITEADFSLLVKAITEDESLREFYCRYTSAYAMFQRTDISYHAGQIDKSADCVFDQKFWQEMACYERSAEAVKEVDSLQAYDHAAGVKERQRQFKITRQISRPNLAVAIISFAALFMLIGYVMLNPFVPTSVATLTDSYAAEWLDGPIEKGGRLTTGRHPFVLLSGYAKLEFENGAEVIVEGPSKFELLNAEQMRVDEGRLTAIVPPAAAGFRVDTAAMSVIDMGTEFSIETAFPGISAVHMVEGKASLRAGGERAKEDGQLLTPGMARRADLQTGQVIDIQYEESRFIRRFDSGRSFMWRGQPVDLSSIIAGGDGFTVVRGTEGIDPKTGRRANQLVNQAMFATGFPVQAEESRYIDSVFIPDGGLGACIVSSAGTVFKECPDTTGPGGSTTGATRQNIQVFRGYDIRTVGEQMKDMMPVFEGIAKGTDETPAVLMHSNVGITFDLQAIRDSMPGTEIAQFISSAGLPDSERGQEAAADVWVLVDGQKRFHRGGLTARNGLQTIRIDISPTERFLTLCVTDAADASSPGEAAMNDDYVYFVVPQLTLKGVYGLQK